MEFGVLRRLLQAAYAETGQDEGCREIRTASEATLRCSAPRVLGRPLEFRHMPWALNTLRDHWVPSMTKPDLNELVLEIRRTTGPGARPKPATKRELVAFVRERNNTDNLRRVVRSAFLRAHRVQRQVGKVNAAGITMVS